MRALVNVCAVLCVHWNGYCIEIRSIFRNRMCTLLITDKMGQNINQQPLKPVYSISWDVDFRSRVTTSAILLCRQVVMSEQPAHRFLSGRHFPPGSHGLHSVSIGCHRFIEVPSKMSKSWGLLSTIWCLSTFDTVVRSLTICHLRVYSTEFLLFGTESLTWNCTQAVR